MRGIFKNKRGFAYVEHAIGLFVVLIVICAVLGTFRFFTLRVQMDRIAEDLLETATFTGCFGSQFQERADSLKTEYFDFTVTCSADNYFNLANKQVQLGDTMWVEITVTTSLNGGLISLPFTLTVKKSGLSEHYWK